MLLAAVAFPLIGVVLAAVDIWRGSPDPGLASVIAFLVGVCGPIVILVGVVRFASPIRARDAAGGAITGPRMRTAKLLVPVSMAQVALSSVLTMGAIMLAYEGLRGPELLDIWTMGTLGVLAGSAWAARNFLSCRLCASLSLRSDRRGLARVFKVLSWLSVVMLCVLLTAVVILVAAYCLYAKLEQPNASGGRPVLWTAYVVVQSLLSLDWLALLAWLIAWPIVLFVFAKHLRRVLAFTRENAGLIIQRAAEPEAVPTRSNPSPG